MKKLLLISITLLPLLVAGQTVIISDDFESYTPGDMLGATSPVWTTWSGGAGDDAPISDAQAFSGSNSLYIIGNVGPADIVLPFPSDYTSGIYELKLKLFIVSGKGAYYNFQQNAVPGIDWMFEIYYDNSGGGELNAGGVGIVGVDYTPDTWIDNRIVVDLNNDLAEFFIDELSIYSWQWSLGATGAGAENMWGGMDIFAAALNNQDAEFYVDDVVFSQLNPTGIDENNFASFIHVSPNPSDGQINIQMNEMPAGEYQIEFVDLLGNRMSNEYAQVSGTWNKNYDLDLASGIYFVRITDGVYTANKKIIVN